MPRKTSRAALDAFLGHLTATGNFALAADRAALAKSGLYKRMLRDEVFAQACKEAIYSNSSRRSHSNSPSPSGEGATCRRQAGEGASIAALPGEVREAQAYLTAANDFTLTIRSNHMVQVRRSPAGRLTQAGIDAFLRALAATANVRLAANSVGVAHSSIYARRRRDPHFAEAMQQALDIGFDRLEAALLHTACSWLEEVPPHAAGVGRGTIARRDNGGGVPDAQTCRGHVEHRGEPDSFQDPRITAPISFDQALTLLQLHHRTCREGWRHRSHPIRPPTKEQTQRLLASALRKVKVMFPEDGAPERKERLRSNRELRRRERESRPTGPRA